MSIDLGSAYGKIIIDGSGVEAGVRQATGALGGFQQRAGAMLGSVSRVAGIAMLGVGAAAVGGFGMAMRAAVDMNSTLETSTLQFTTLMGDADKATAHVAALFEFAEKTPFETGPIIDASLKLQTFGGAALNTMENIKLIGDASAAVSAPIDELGFWVGRLYSNLQGGQPFGEAAMRLQELAVMSPQARQQMEEMQKAGASAEEIFTVFQESLGGFTGAMEAQAGTWAGLTSTIKDQLNIMTATALKPFFDLMKEGLASIVALLNSPEMQAAIAAFAAQLAAFAATMMAWITETLIPFIQEYGPAIIQVLQALAIAFGALMVIAGVVALVNMLLNPIAWVAAAVGLLAAAWINDWGGIQGKTEAVINFIRPFIETAIGAIRTFIETTLAAIRKFWEEHGEGILKFTQGIWETIKLAIGGFLDAIMLIFQAFKQLFSGDWEALGNTLMELWQNAWDTITGVLAKLWETFLPLFTSLWTSIQTWWNGIDWAGLGNNLITGIVNGIKRAGNAIRDTIMGLAQDAWEAVKAFFGIQSPSRLMMYAGEMIGAGLIDGVEGQRRAVERAMATLGKSSFAALNLQAAGGGPSYNQQVVNQSAYVYGGLYLQRDTSFNSALEEMWGIQ